MTVVKMIWRSNNLTDPLVQQLLAEHQDRMADHSPPESRHVLDVDALRKPEITFWSMWQGEHLMGCVALKHWDKHMGEIKSMKTAPGHTRQGVGKQLLQHVLSEATDRGYKQLKLETGSMAYFEPARKLYITHGFQLCEPFGDYTEDPNSVFMNLDL